MIYQACLKLSTATKFDETKPEKNMTTKTLSKIEIEAFERDGAILVKNAVSEKWVKRLLTVIDKNLSNPSKWANDNDQGDGVRMFTDRYQWRSNETIRDYIFNSGIAGLVAQAMGSSTARFYFDHLLIKEPNTNIATPWHQDTPYWPFKGYQIASAWLSLTKNTVQQSSMEFIRGSHRSRDIYRPEAFGGGDKNPNASWTGKQGGKPVPAIEADRDAFDILGFDVEPGDAIIFSAWTLHGAPGNTTGNTRRAALSTRWLGDDVTWYPHVGADPIVGSEDVSIKSGEAPHDDEVFPCCWRQP
jgi:ectoine hydroxylase-related dioxygenase (phytanoyl-CoA dioxygenase family)